MKIGLDFDGVIADSELMKQRLAKELYGVDIPLHLLNRQGVVASGKLTEEEYDDLQDQAYGTRKYSLQILPIEGMKPVLIELQKNHELVIVTSRDERKSAIAQEWLTNQGLTITIRSVGRKNEKTSFCKDVDVFIDNDLYKLEPLIGVVKHLYHFNPYSEEQILPPGIINVPDWKTFAQEIITLKN